LLLVAKEVIKADLIRKRRRDARTFAARYKAGHDQGILCGDMALQWNRLKDDSVDLFLTDPQWNDVKAYARLAELAAAKLKPGRLCVCCVGKLYLPDVLDVMRKHLEYWWIFAVALSSPHVLMQDRKISTRWHAMLAFSKGKCAKAPETVADVLLGGCGRQKELHEWQKAEGEAEYLIDRLTRPGEIVVDPFCGSGTIPAACKAMGRRWLATEIDKNHVAVARRRLAEAGHGE
jgi:site-specific DNA-methyltransferase (adenine-specific)